jgi:hypothetical protein
MKEVRNSILAGLAFGFSYGLFSLLGHDLNYALITGSLSGLLFGVTLYFISTSRAIKRQTQIEIADGESLIYSGSASHVMNGEAVGGKLYLLKDRLEFKSHRFNIQNHTLIIETVQIASVNFSNTLWVIPNGLSFKLVNGKTEKFVVNDRNLWKQQIDKVRPRVTDPRITDRKLTRIQRPDRIDE